MPRQKTKRPLAGLHLAFIALLGLAVAGCDEEGPVSTVHVLDPATAVGAYMAADSTGEFKTTAAGQTVDWLAEGGSLTIELDKDGSTTGWIFLPGADAEGEDFEADLIGTWEVRGETIYFNHDADTFVRDMPFFLRDGRLEGYLAAGGVQISVVLESL